METAKDSGDSYSHRRSREVETVRDATESLGTGIYSSLETARLSGGCQQPSKTAKDPLETIGLSGDCADLLETTIDSHATANDSLKTVRDLHNTKKINNSILFFIFTIIIYKNIMQSINT